MPAVSEMIRFNASGLVPDLSPDRAPLEAFNEGANVTFRDGVPSRVLGYSAAYTNPPIAPEALGNLRTPLVNYWVSAGRTDLHATDGTTWASIKPASGWVNTTDYNQWTLSRINNAIVLNHPLMAPIYWQGGLANLAVPLAGWPVGARAQVMRSHRYHLFALNITDGSGTFQDMVMWSAAANPGTVPPTWAAAATNQAGLVELAQGGGAIRDGLTLRDQFAIYKDSAIWCAQYVGGNQVFTFRNVSNQIGIISRNAVVAWRGMHIVAGQDDIYLFDGQNVQSIADQRIRRWLFNQIDVNQFNKCYMVADPYAGEVLFCFPSAGNTFPNLAAVWNTDANAWGIREFRSPCAGVGIVSPNAAGIPTWDTPAGIWDAETGSWDTATYNKTYETVLAYIDATLINFDNSVSANGAPIASRLVKSGIGLGNPEQKKLVKRIWPRLSGSAGTPVTIRVGAHDSPNAPVQWSQPVTINVGEQVKVDSFACGRFMAFDIQSNSLQPWALTGLDVEYSPQGLF